MLELTTDEQNTGFHVSLDQFQGPFDLLLNLISKHKLEVTAIALHSVTDEFISHIRDQGDAWSLDEATQFLVIAATLLDLKAARLLPSGEVEDEEDLAILEARDLLFARLLQYKAFKDASMVLAERYEIAFRSRARDAKLPKEFSEILPNLVINMSINRLTAIAQRLFFPAIKPLVSISHLHNPAVSVAEQAAVVISRLKEKKVMSFRSLIKDAENVMVVVARFLAILELYKERLIGFEQSQPLGDLTIRWAGGERNPELLSNEFDDQNQEASFE